MNLDELRRQVDAIDGELVALLNRRAKTALRIGETKQQQGAAIHDPEREEAVLQHVRQRNGGPLRDDDLERLFRGIMTACTKLQEERQTRA